jgi:hypothetical protein
MKDITIEDERTPEQKKKSIYIIGAIYLVIMSFSFNIVTLVFIFHKNITAIVVLALAFLGVRAIINATEDKL